jgi:hypothetical protein
MSNYKAPPATAFPLSLVAGLGYTDAMSPGECVA